MVWGKLIYSHCISVYYILKKVANLSIYILSILDYINKKLYLCYFAFKKELSSLNFVIAFIVIINKKTFISFVMLLNIFLVRDGNDSLVPDLLQDQNRISTRQRDLFPILSLYNYITFSSFFLYIYTYIYTVLYTVYIFFLMNGNTERAHCPLSLACIPQEKEKKGSEKNKTSL